jgi:hypothetical protein
MIQAAAGHYERSAAAGPVTPHRMKRDARGLIVSTDSDAAIVGIDRFTADFMAARTEASALFDLAASHEDCGLIQLYAAAMWIYSQSAEDITAHAFPFIARAARQRARLDERELMLLDMIEGWAVNDFQRAITLAECIVERWPRDIIAAKLGEFFFFQAPDYQRHLRFIAGIAAAHPASSSYDAMHAFALALAGHAADAERVAEKGIALDPSTPWAHHALGHVYLAQGRLAEGRAAFERFAPSWAAHMRVLQCHNAWHLALFYIFELQLDGALSLCRERIWGVQPESVNEQIDAVALLWRLDLAGHPTDVLWPAIAAAVAPRAGEQVFPFLNAHSIYALARGGHSDQARAASAAFGAYAERQSGGYRRVWRDIGIPLVEGCRAFAEGEYTRCATLLEPIAGDLCLAGGSDAQNDLFAQTLLVALIESGRRSDAAALLAHRLRGRRPTALEARWIERVA